MHVVRPGLAAIDRVPVPSGPIWLLQWQLGDLANTGPRWVEYLAYVQGDGETAPEPFRIIVHPAP